MFENEDRKGGHTPSGTSRGVGEEGPFPPDLEEIQVITGQREYGTLPRIPLAEPSKKTVHSFSWSLRGFLGFVISLTFLPGLVLPLEYPSSLSAPLISSTPLSIGCVLPATPHHLDSLIKETDRLASTAKILLWPEQALQLYSQEDREIVIRKITDVAKRHGVWIGLGLGSPRSPDEEEKGEEDEPDSSKRRNEIVFVGPEGLVGAYTKRKLVPIVESYGSIPGAETPPLWEVGLTSPRGIRKPEWSKNVPFVRTLGVTPLICLDSLHPGTLTVTSTGSPHKGPRVPQLILLATSPPSHSSAIASMILDHAKDLAVQHHSQVLVCDGSGKEAISGLIDTDGSVRHSQRGQGSFVVKITVPYDCESSNGDRRKTGWEILGTTGVLGLLAGIAASGALLEYLIVEQPSTTNRESKLTAIWNKMKRSIGRERDPENARLIDVGNE